MKFLFAICVMLCTGLVWGTEKPAPPQTAAVVKGEVLEVKDVESYTYLRLKTRDGETWAAVAKTPVKKGAEVTIENAMIMDNFESKSLKKTFPKIIFGTLAAAGAGAVATSSGMMMAPHGGVANMAKMADGADVKVPKASGPNAHTVAEIVTKKSELKDKTVLVHAKVVKYNAGVMGKNWLHLRDGSGLASDNTNDVLVTTTEPAKLGDVVLVKGIVRIDKDFGAGYSYKVLIEEATLQK